MPQEAHVTQRTVLAQLDTHRVLEEAHLGAQVDTEEVVTQHQLTPPTLPDHQLTRHALRQAVQATQLGVPGGLWEDTGQVVRQLDKEKVTVTRGQQVCGTVRLVRLGRGYRGHETREWGLDIVRIIIIIITVNFVNPLPEGGFNDIIMEI